MTEPSLLPRTSVRLERLAAQALADIRRVPIPLRQLYDPDACPVELLPYLAWTFSVDRWDPAWPEAAKRAAIRAAYFIHQHKGTIGALRRVVEPLGYLIEVQEWFQTEPSGKPGTFALKVGVTDEGISEETYRELTRLIDDAKPLSRHLTGLAISLGATGMAHVATLAYDGDELDIYPPAPRDLDVMGSFGLGGRDHTVDIMDIAHG